ncbi:MAG: hypothetical protein NWT02_03085 [Opitutales bacterium]|jgi:hypothetical protein|nr:hypothetical protein [Opitutales bacterium]MDP4644240.1 hypothetical protein [Opitutales bacterium]MDP4884518.1 hypothetical protein [Opitutales bacterium]
MIPEFTKAPLSLKVNRSDQGGFALVIALGLMAFVLLLLLSITTLVQVESRSASGQLSRLQAEQAAVLSLNVAIGKLQETIGPDQRVTATASILGDTNNPYANSVSPVAGQAAWMGVWKSGTVAKTGVTPDYNPSTPNTRNFVGWLVSGTDALGNFQLPSALSAVASDLASSGREFVTLYSDSTGDPYIQVEKVLVESEASQNTYFAFSVEDESTKADLGWSEIPIADTTKERSQASRISATPGPDYGALNGSPANGPFTAGVIDYPLTIGGSSVFLSESVSKLNDVGDLAAAINTVDADWLRDQRSDMTWGSKGVLADVKFGGLRRDLSLAFEMDGADEVEDATKFNQQEGVFVGGTDRFASPFQVPGMPAPERYLWREKDDSGTPFSSYIEHADAVLRGPTWWALRDYANLYKRLKRSGNNYTLDARAYYPNRDAGAYRYSDIFQAITGGYKVWDVETEPRNSRYIHKPARPNYAPVYLGSVSMISVVPYQGNLALGVDQVFYIWNPYNRNLTFDNMAVSSPSYAYPGTVSLWMTKGSGAEEQYGPTQLREYLGKNAGGSRSSGISYLLRDPSGPITMEPGEVLVFTADPATTPGSEIVNRGTASPGLSESDVNISGIIMTNLDTPGGWTSVPFDTSVDKVRFNYVQYGVSGGERYIVATGLPEGATDAGDISPTNYGEELQYSLHNTASGGFAGARNYVSPSALRGQLNTPVDDMPPTFLAGKRFFGLFGMLKKPADFGRDPDGDPIDQRPVEGLSVMNPLQALYATDIWGTAHPNQLFMTVSSTNSNALYNSYGINFPSGNNGNWGVAYTSNGSTHLPMLDIPSSPPISLATFSHANLGIIGADPMRMVGYSRANTFVYPESVFDRLYMPGNVSTPYIGQDSAWLANDTLFDRYYLSGIAPEYTIGTGGYSATGSINATLTDFYSTDWQEAQANPVLRPYIPSNKSIANVIDELDKQDGYLKTGAYSLIEGAFNVNSTSIPAWAAFLRGNRDLAIDYVDGTSDNGSGTPFPSNASPVPEQGSSNSFWSGFSRLNDPQIDTLATEIVNQVKLRGPFMSLSDFVNHRTGAPLNALTHYAGALQTAIDDSGINYSVENLAGGVPPVYPSGNNEMMTGIPPSLGSRTTSSGVPKEINQPDLLLPLAPRLTARGDTFRIRGYGEIESIDGSRVSAICEVVVQRLPEYIDTTDDPWNETLNPQNTSLPSPYPLTLAVNQTLGRRLKVVKFRWLEPNEI